VTGPRRLHGALKGLTIAAFGLAGVSGALAQTATQASIGDLCVTEGALERGADGRLTVTAPAMRAFATLGIGDAAETRFSYLGATEVQSHLGSGAVREQFGLKLRAQDPCNLVYVMWRIAPDSRLVVQVKTNPVQHTSAECGNHGYQTIKPRTFGRLPQLPRGQAHTLRAQISGNELRAWVDGKLAWLGDFGTAPVPPAGPIGVRSDNAQITFSLAVGPGPKLAASQIPECRSGSPLEE
jgi:hypothetical protein